MARARRTMKYFVLRQGNRDTDHVFTGVQPRRAALKAATRGFTNVELRERGTDKVHAFRGSRRRVAAPADRPEWLPATVWRPVVRKIGTRRLKAAKKAKPARRARKAVRRKAAPRRKARRAKKRPARRARRAKRRR